MKLFASDFDGTLSKNHIGVSHANKKAIEQWQKKGYLFGFVSGRDYYNLKEVARNEHIKIDFYVCFNGAYVVDGKQKVLFEQRLDTDLTQLLTTLKKQTISFLMVSLDKYYFFHRPSFHKIRNQMGMYAYIKVNQLIHKREKTRKFELFQSDLPIQISCLTKSNEAAQKLASMVESIDDTVHAMVNNCYVDLIAKGVDKAVGVKAIQEALSMDYQNIYVAGDNYNDVEMIEAYQSFVMADGVDFVKERATHVVEHVSDALKQLMEESNEHSTN